MQTLPIILQLASQAYRCRNALQTIQFSWLTSIYLLSDSLYKNLEFFVSFVLIYYLYPQHPNKLCRFKVAKTIGLVMFCQNQTLLAFATNNQNSHTQST